MRTTIALRTLALGALVLGACGDDSEPTPTSLSTSMRPSIASTSISCRMPASCASAVMRWWIRSRANSVNAPRAMPG